MSDLLPGICPICDRLQHVHAAWCALGADRPRQRQLRRPRRRILSRAARAAILDAALQRALRRGEPDTPDG